VSDDAQEISWAPESERAGDIMPASPREALRELVELAPRTIEPRIVARVVLLQVRREAA
jgi:hypothetical protein